MMLGGTPFFQNNHPQGFQMDEGVENSTLSSSAGVHSQTLWYNLSVLRDKVQQVQPLVSLVVSPDPIQQESIALAASAAAAAVIQEIIVAASSMMDALQHAAAGDISHPHDMKASYEGSARLKGPDRIDRVLNDLEGGRMGIVGAATHYSTISVTPIASAKVDNGHRNKDNSKKPGSPSSNVIELDAADLLMAKYTHNCLVCGKGFKRDANLRMHMRAHGDEYKTNAALCNPMKGGRGSTMGEKDDPPFMKGGRGSTMGEKDDPPFGCLPRKYSCPQEGCRWNKNHAKFQPLKSVICVKNHYKRSHCPKMYVCNRCNQKKFSVLSDLRTHEKHCGDLKWMCSCGTTFSRKDKLMGHVALFVGHTPI